ERRGGSGLIGFAGDAELRRFTIATGLWLIGSRCPAAKDRHHDQPTLGQLIVANHGIPGIGVFASAAQDVKEGSRLHPAVTDFAGAGKFLSFLGIDRHAGVDDLKNVVGSDGKTVVRRIAEDRGALRTFEASPKPIEVRDHLGAWAIALTSLFDRLPTGWAG